MGKKNNGGLIVSYDKTADVLYLSMGKPAAGFDEEVSDGIFVRLHPKSKKPAGILIMDFEKRFSNSRTCPIPVTFNDLSYAAAS